MCGVNCIRQSGDAAAGIGGSVSYGKGRGMFGTRVSGRMIRVATVAVLRAAVCIGAVGAKDLSPIR